MRRIAIVIPVSQGGVRYSTEKLVRGLRRDGFRIEQITLHSNVLTRTIRDLRTIPTLREFDAIIYAGSIPQVNHLFVKSEAKVILFVHGLVLHEAARYLRDHSTSLREKVYSLYLASLWSISKSLKRVNLYICRSLTSCEENGLLKENYILLPQFIFPEELEAYSRFNKYTMESNDKEHFKVRVVTYTSFTLSPRLLPTHYIIASLRCTSRRVKGKLVELTVIDPRLKEEKEERWDNLIVRYVKFLPRRDFLKLLATADLYIERCIDEELGGSSMEAGLLGIPSAKLTHPKFVARQDYGNEVMWSSSFRGLVDILSDYIAYVDYWKPYYAKKLREFLVTRRSWDVVKKPLVNFLKQEH